MKRNVVVSVLVLVGVSFPLAAAACPDYDAALASVDFELDWHNGAGEELLDAYEAVATAWLCANPDGTAADLVAWAPSVPGSRKKTAGQSAILLGHDRVLIVWRRSDVALGGRAVLYARDKSGDLVRHASVDLTGGLKPEIVGRLGRRVVISEFNIGANYSAGQLRVFWSYDDGLVEESRLGDLFDPEVLSVSARKIRMRVLRKAAYSTGGPTFNRFELTITKRRKGKVAFDLEPEDKGLDVLDRYCAAETSKDRRKLVKGKKLATRLPDCNDVQVLEVTRKGETTRISILGRFSCPTRGHMTSPKDATLTVAKVRGSLKITKFSVDGCPQVRAWRDGDGVY